MTNELQILLTVL